MIEQGVETIPISNDDVHNFYHMEASFPEFTKNAHPLVLGGFAAYGNPSSFHHTYVKKLRKQCLQKVLLDGIFQRFLKKMKKEPSDYKVEVLFDRILHRFPGQAPVAETAHRDITPHSELCDGDFVFGGWVNLSNTDQYFVCKPGSHLDVRDTKTAAGSSHGFNNLSKESTKTDYIPFRKTWTIKPGHIIIFPQHILHEVLGKKSKYEQLRLFVGWRLTTSNRLLFEQEKETVIRTLSVPRLPSGQIPPMYSSNHASIFKNKAFNYTSLKKGTLLGWIDTSFIDHVKARLVNGTMYKRCMLSLAEYDLKRGYEYSEADANLMLSLHNIT